MDTNTGTNTCTNTINENDLFMKYKSSYLAAFCDLNITLSLLCFGNYMVYLLKDSYFVYGLIPFMSLINMKFFLSHHDCSHNSYTPNKTLNYIIGTFAGMLTSGVSMNWMLDHSTHHLTNGNTTNKFNYAYNETTRITYKQYSKFNWMGRAISKFLLHPVIHFSLMPFLYFCVIQRFIYIVKKIKYKSKIQESMFMICLNHFIHNVGFFAFCYYINQLGFLHLYFLYAYISEIYGVLLFFNQHTFNTPYMVTNEEWNQRDSGIIGSSLIQIPWYLKYFFYGIEYHHIHHINAKIPGYNLQKYHEEVVQNSNLFDNIVKLSMKDCYNNLWLVMYDEDNKKFLTFEEADKQMEESKSK
jgi:omega-6 fatty acid desaturase (delta-12 desaturase)